MQTSMLLRTWIQKHQPGQLVLTPTAILLAGAVLRIVGLTVSPIWFDEAYTIYLARLPDMMIRLEFSDFNPPLWQIVVYPFILLFGENELAIRLPSLIASLGAMWLAWRIADELVFQHWKGNGIRAAVAGMIALLPYEFWLAQDGRPYAVMALIYLGVLVFALRGRWLGYGACLGLLLYVHTTGAFYAAAAGLGALAWKWSDRKKIILWSAAAGLAFVPWIPSLFITAKEHWLGPLTDNKLLTALYAAIFAADLPAGVDLAAALLVFVSIVAALLVSRARWNDRAHLVLTIWAVGPLALLIAAAPIKNLIFYRPLSAMALPLGIWLAACLWPRADQPRLWHWLMPYLWAVLIAASLVNWTPGLKGGELRQVAQMINDQWQTGDVVYHATGTTYLPFSLYLDHPGYLLNEEQHDGLLQTHLQKEFHIPRAALEDIPHRRAWLVIPGDPLMSARAVGRMEEYSQGSTLVGMVHYWQAADIQVFLVTE